MNSRTECPGYENVQDTLSYNQFRVVTEKYHHSDEKMSHQVTLRLKDQCINYWCIGPHLYSQSNFMFVTTFCRIATVYKSVMTFLCQYWSVLICISLQ